MATASDSAVHDRPRPNSITKNTWCLVSPTDHCDVSVETLYNPDQDLFTGGPCRYFASLLAPIGSRMRPTIDPVTLAAGVTGDHGRT